MTGVILFRAQPFHNGHLSMIKKAVNDCKKTNSDLHIFIGSADKSGTKRNPFPIDLRYLMVRNSVKEAFTEEEFAHIHIHTLKDLTDETDNSHNWGRYLFIKMLKETQDPDMTIYYSDNPAIMLGWFDDDTLRKICGLDGTVRLVITIGYAKEDDKLRTKKRKDFDELVTQM